MGVRFRKDRNKWCVDIYIDGKRIKKLFDTEADACQYETTLSGGTPEGMSDLKSSIHRYYNTFSVRKKRPKFEKYMFGVLFDHLQSSGVNKLSLINISHLQSFQTNLLIKKMKPSSINRMFHTYKHYFNCCVDWGLIHQSPAARLKSLPESKVITRKVWTDEQIEEVIGKLTGWIKLVVELVSYTGMRPCEVMKLEWDRDINFKEELIRASSFKGMGEERQRWIPIHRKLYISLREWRLQTPSNLVFPSKIMGKSITTDSAARALRKHAQEGFTLYGIRHSFGTRANANGVDIRSIQTLMGHSNIRMTQVYTHVSDEHLKGAIKKAFSGSQGLVPT